LRNKTGFMDYRIKDLPEEERPREKLEDIGAKNLSETELLSIVLRTGTKGKNVKELSSEILNQYSLEEIANRDLEELKEFQGISRVKAGQLVAVGELSRRLKVEERETIESLSDVQAKIEDMKFLESEVLRIFYLNAGNEIVKEEEISGGISEVGFESQEIIREGILCNAAAFIMVHNHPSGKSESTQADIEATEDLREIGEKLGIDMLDHVVVGDEVVSMKSTTSIWR
jgi:DNA repair protein RadC